MSVTRPAKRAKRTAPPRGPASAPAPRLGLSVQQGDGAGPWPVDRSQLRRWILAALQSDACLTLRLVMRAEGRALNQHWRGQDHATNVLTFAYGGDPLQADIVICLPVVQLEARKQGKRLRDHLAHLVIHGALHAQGHDHENDHDAAVMESLETRILRRFRIADPYAVGHTRVS